MHINGGTNIFTPRRDLPCWGSERRHAFQKVVGVGSLCHCTAGCGTLKEGAGVSPKLSRV